MTGREKDARIQELERQIQTLKACMANPCKHCTVDHWMDEDTRNKATIAALQAENEKLRAALARNK